MRIRAIMTTAASIAVAVTATIAAAPAHATDLSTVLDNPDYWLQSDVADIYQWINTSYSSTHPLYSVHRMDVLLDDGRKPLDGITYLKLSTTFSVVSGTQPQDEFVSAVRLPAGVRIVDTNATPIFCRYAPNALFSDATVPFTLVADNTCRQGVKDLGQNTFAVNDKVLNRGDIWEVYVPVATDRALGAADPAAAKISYFASNAIKDATMPDVAEVTNVLVLDAPRTSSGASSASGGSGAASTSTAKSGTRCAKAGAKSAGLTCVKAKGRLVWKRR